MEGMRSGRARDEQPQCLRSLVATYLQSGAQQDRVSTSVEGALQGGRREEKID